MAGIVVEGTGVQTLLASARARMLAASREALNESGKHLESQVKRRVPVSSGRLRSTIGYLVTSDTSLDIGSIHAEGGEILAYAGIQEFGGTVTGKPWLAIPLAAVKTKAGVGGIRARDFKGRKDVFFQTSKAGNLILFQKLGQTKTGKQKTKRFFRQAGDGVGPAAPERSSIVPLFVLKPSVSIKPKGYLIPTVEAELPRVRSFLAARVVAEFRSAFGG